MNSYNDASRGAQYPNADLALMLAAADIQVFPCLERQIGRKDPKAPYTQHGFHDASSDVERVRAWWTRYPGALVGVVPGQPNVDALVLDLDRKPGKPDGVLAFENAVLETVRASMISSWTPGGGQHVWVKRPAEGHRNDRGALPAGIDVRCDAGYVCLGVLADGSRYMADNVIQALVEGWEWPDMPDAVVALLCQPAPSKPQATADVPASAVNEGLVLSALRSLPVERAEDYQSWLEIGMALHSWSKGSADALAAWEDWSSQATNFGQCVEKWKSFGKSTGVMRIGIGTLFHVAQAVGWTFDRGEREAAEDSTRQLAARLRTRDGGGRGSVGAKAVNDTPAPSAPVASDNVVPFQAPRQQVAVDVHAELERMAREDLKRKDPIRWAEQIDLLHTNAATHNGKAVKIGDLKDGYKRARELIKREEKKQARDSNDAITKKGELELADFLYLPTRDRYVHARSGGYWTATGVNSAVHGEDPAEEIRETRRVDGIVWDPTMPRIVPNMTLLDDYAVPCEGSSLFNQYTPARISSGDPAKADVWVRHLRTLYPDEADEIILALAFFVQHPGVKINWMWMMLGEPGIGKDWLLQPLIYAAGAHNAKTVKPAELLADFDEYRRCTLLVVNELSELGKNHSKYALYEQLKPLCAAPPTHFTVNAKYKEKTVARNCMFTIGMSNNRERAVYLPANDRRTFACNSDVTRDDLAAAGVNWDEHYGWMDNGGAADVVAYLQSVDASTFSPGRAPRKTAAWKEIVDWNKPLEQVLAEDHRDTYGDWPDVIDVAWLLQQPTVPDELKVFFSEGKNKPKFSERMRVMGYERTDNPDEAQGRWRVDGKRIPLYVTSRIAKCDRVASANAWVYKRRGG